MADKDIEQEVTEEVTEETTEEKETATDTMAGEETEAASEDDKKDTDKDKKKKCKGDKKLEALEEKVKELEDKDIRRMAEFENFRKRTEKEKATMFEMGAKSVIEKILPVVDNFERGLDSATDEKKSDPVYEGMNLIYKQLMTELDSIGVKPIEAVGVEFNPEFHNAVMQEESDEVESGFVTKELQKGYTYRDSVVRHSMVAVAQ